MHEQAQERVYKHAREGVGSVRGRDGRPLRASPALQPAGGMFERIVSSMARQREWAAAGGAVKRRAGALQPRLYGLDDLAGPGGYRKLHEGLLARLDLLDGPGRRLAMVVLDRVLNGEAEEPPLDLDYLARAAKLRRDRIDAQLGPVGTALGWSFPVAAGAKRIKWPDGQAARRFLLVRAERCRRVAPLAGLSSRRRAQMRKLVDVDPRRPEHEQLVDWLCLEWMDLHQKIQEERQRLQKLGVNVGDDPIDLDGSEAAKRAANGYRQTAGSARKRLKQSVLHLGAGVERARQLWADERVVRELTLHQTWCWVSFRSIRELVLGQRLPEAVPELLLDAAAVRHRAARMQVAINDWLAAAAGAEAEAEAEAAAPSQPLPVELERRVEVAVEERLRQATPAPVRLPDMPFPGSPREPEPAAAPELSPEKQAQLAELEAVINERRIALRQEANVHQELADKTRGRSRWSTAPPGD